MLALAQAATCCTMRKSIMSCFLPASCPPRQGMVTSILRSSRGEVRGTYALCDFCSTAQLCFSTQRVARYVVHHPYARVCCRVLLQVQKGQGSL